MAVGAGSIKRASKLNTEAEGTKKATAKAVEKKTATKKEASTVKQVADIKATSAKAAAKVVETTSINPVCHLTEELPIHLLQYREKVLYLGKLNLSGGIKDGKK